MSAATDLAARLGLRRVGHQWRGDCPICAYRDSLALSIARDGRPLIWCASCQDRAGIAALLRGGSAPYHDPKRQEASGVRRVKRERTIEQALQLWRGSEPAEGTPADRYLTERALPGLASAAVLRFRADCPHPSGARLPAMIALIMDTAGQSIGVHRTFLRADGSAKTSIQPARASLGDIRHGAVRLDPAASELVIGEGIETSASAGRVLRLPAWAAISCGNLATGLVLPAGVRSVIIAADADGPGRHAAYQAHRRFTDEGRHVRIAVPDREGVDFNDLLRASKVV